MLRYLHDYGPATAWRCTYAAAKRNTHLNLTKTLERPGLIEKVTDERRKMYAITEKGTTYMQTLAELLKLLGIDTDNNNEALVWYNSQQGRQ